MEQIDNGVDVLFSGGFRDFYDGWELFWWLGVGGKNVFSKHLSNFEEF